jgi:hypothetical protein
MPDGTVNVVRSLLLGPKMGYYGNTKPIDTASGRLTQMAMIGRTPDHNCRVGPSLGCVGPIGKKCGTPYRHLWPADWFLRRVTWRFFNTQKQDSLRDNLAPWSLLPNCL